MQAQASAESARANNLAAVDGAWSIDWVLVTDFVAQVAVEIEAEAKRAVSAAVVVPTWSWTQDRSELLSSTVPEKSAQIDQIALNG